MLKEMDERKARALFRTTQQLQEKLPRLRTEQKFIRAFNQRWKELGYQEQFGKLPWGTKPGRPVARRRRSVSGGHRARTRHSSGGK
jgi:hypothetical protein